MTTNAPIEIDTTTFTADYEVTERLERPNTSRPFFVIPEGGNSYGPDYLVAVKRNDGSAWIGQVRCGDEPKLLRGIWATPGPAHACFANGGYVYLVDTRDPIQVISLPGRA